MPIYELNDDFIFPPVEHAEEDGLLAVGGDLLPQRLLTAYTVGIFPWYSAEDPIMWWSPDPRLVLYPEDLRISKSMKQVFRKEQFKITFDTDFKTVIDQCSKVPRRGQDGTWITTEMKMAFQRLHELGFAHSVEVWENEKLVGGLYGLSVGRVYFGESMFMKVSNASKAGFIQLVSGLKQLDFGLIDCQVRTNHLVSLGAVEITRQEFIKQLSHGLRYQSLRGKWTDIEELQKPPVELQGSKG